MSKNHTGVLEIKYQEVSQIVNNSDDDWIKFIESDSDGLTKHCRMILNGSYFCTYVKQSEHEQIDCVNNQADSRSQLRWYLMNM